PKPSATPASSQIRSRQRRWCAAGTLKDSPYDRTTGWWHTRASSSPRGGSPQTPCCPCSSVAHPGLTTPTKTSNCGPREPSGTAYPAPSVLARQHERPVAKRHGRQAPGQTQKTTRIAKVAPPDEKRIRALSTRAARHRRTGG